MRIIEVIQFYLSTIRIIYKWKICSQSNFKKFKKSDYWFIKGKRDHNATVMCLINETSERPRSTSHLWWRHGGFRKSTEIRRLQRKWWVLDRWSGRMDLEMEINYNRNTKKSCPEELFTTYAVTNNIKVL